MALLNQFDVFPEDLAEAVHNFASHTFKLMLTNTAPNTSTGATKADITQISNGNGYTTDGASLTTTTSAQTSGTYKWIVDDYTWTATGTMGPFRYVVLYNSTANRLIGYYDRGSSLTLASGETFKADADQTNGLLRIS